MNKNKILNILETMVFVATVVSPIVAFCLAGIIGEVEIFSSAGIVRYSWIMWLFMPFPICSILIGKKLKQYKQDYLKIYIAGFVCLALLTIMGVFRFIGNGTSYDANQIVTIEQKTKLDLPNQVKMITEEWDSYTVSYTKIVNGEETFEREIKNSLFWKDNLSSKIKGLLPLERQYNLNQFDYFMFYNITLDEYNQYPPDGEYECIFIAYDCELQRFIILDDWKVALD